MTITWTPRQFLLFLSRSFYLKIRIGWRFSSASFSIRESRSVADLAPRTPSRYLLGIRKSLRFPALNADSNTLKSVLVHYWPFDYWLLLFLILKLKRKYCKDSFVIDTKENNFGIKLYEFSIFRIIHNFWRFFFIFYSAKNVNFKSLTIKRFSFK